jgi:cellulase/cellobiase CelA1
MIKKLLALTGGVGCAMALQGCAVGADGAEESISTLDTNISSTISITGDWGGVYCANVSVANNLTKPGNSWKVVLDMKGSSIEAIKFFLDGGNIVLNVFHHSVQQWTSLIRHRQVI